MSKAKGANGIKLSGAHSSETTPTSHQSPSRWRWDDTFSAATGQRKGGMGIRKTPQYLLQSSPGGKNMELTSFEHMLWTKPYVSFSKALHGKWFDFHFWDE